MSTPKDLAGMLATVRYHLAVMPDGPCTRCGATFPWPVGQACPEHPEVLVEKMLGHLVWFIDGLITEEELLNRLAQLPQDTLDRMPKYWAPNAPIPLYVKLKDWQKTGKSDHVDADKESLEERSSFDSEKPQRRR